MKREKDRRTVERVLWTEEEKKEFAVYAQQEEKAGEDPYEGPTQRRDLNKR